MSHSKVYELNGEEQIILVANCEELRSITRGKVKRQDAIKLYEAEIKMLQSKQQGIISYMAKRFGLTKIQVINKVFAENKK